MNKNLLFLTIILSAMVNEALATNRKTKRRSHFGPEEQAADDSAHKARGAQQNTTRAQRAERRTMIKEQPEALENLTAIIEHCFASQFDQAAELIKQKNINVLTDKRRYNILQIACELYPFTDDENIDLAATLAFLIEQGANPNHRNNEHQTILHTACQNNLEASALDVIVEYLDPTLIDGIDGYGRHALHYACLRHNDATNYLIQHNIGQAFLLHRDHQNMTPLDLATVSSSNQLTELVNFRPAQEHGIPPLLWAAANNMTSVVTGLIRNGHNVNTANQGGVTALHIAAESGHIATVQALLQAHGIEVNTVNQEGNTALHTAARSGHTAIVQALLERGADINAANQNGYTALHIAVYDEMTAIVQALLAAQNINVNAQTNNRNTALHFAAEASNIAIVQVLIQAHGINVNTQNHDGFTALHRAAQRGRTEIAQALLAVPGINVNNANLDGETALHCAIKEGHITIAQALLATQNINVNTATQGGLTPLHTAAQHGHLTIVQALLNAGANVNATSQHGYTALHIAVYHEMTAIVQALLAAQNINVNTASQDGITALHAAARIGNTEIVQALLERGANTALPLNNGQTAADVARTPEIRQLILDAAARQQ